MRSLPKSVAELDSNKRWTIECYLQLIEEIACDPEAFEAGGPGGEEAKERIRRAARLRGGMAAMVDGLRVELREFWQAFPELQLLGEHFRQVALWKEGRVSPGITDPPSPEQGLEETLAEPMAGYTPEQREAHLMGLRILVRVVVRAHMGQQTASLEAGQDGGEEE